MSKLIDLYTQMLDSIGVVVDSQGFASLHYEGASTSTPWEIEGKRVVLPTKEQLAQSDWSKRIGFHPLYQNFSAGESPVMDAVRARASNVMNFYIGNLFSNIAMLGSKREKHMSLTPEQAKYLAPVAEADKKLVNTLATLTTITSPKNRGFEFIRINVQKGREWKGQKRNRVAVATFPLYELVCEANGPTTIGGLKVTGKQVSMIRSLYKFIFDKIDNKPNYYEVGSDSKISPSVDSLYGLLGEIIGTINNHSVILQEAVGANELPLITNEWMETLSDLPALAQDIRSIPPLEGNAGRDRLGKEALAPAIITEAPAKGAKAKKAKAEVTDTGTAVVTQEFIEEAKVQTTPQNPFRRRIGDATSAQEVDPRTQLPEEHVSVVPPRQRQVSNINMDAFEPTPVATQFVHERRAQERQAFRSPIAQQQVINNGPQVQKIPESARLINGVLYIPLEVKGTAQPPAGSIVHDGTLYIPLNGATQAPVQSAFGQPRTAFGMGAVSDPAQVPGLSQAEIDFYRQNPALFQAFLAERSSAVRHQANMQQNERLNELPPYLQRLQEADQVARMQTSRFGQIRR